MGQPLSYTEALMWNLGRDPNLANTMGLVAIIDGKPDIDRARDTLAKAVVGIERFQQRIVAPDIKLPGNLGPLGGALPGPLAGRLGKPYWEFDEQFEIDHHFRVVRLGAGRTTSDAELRRAAAQFINDPFDLARPLWQFQLVLGLAKGRSALLGKVHHSIADGLGLLRLAGHILEFNADAPAPPSLDLDAALADNRERADVSEADDTDDDGDRSTSERLLGWLQSATQSLPDPKKLVEAGAEAAASARAVNEHLPKSAASELWSTRSRNRRIEFLSVSLDSLRTRAELLGVTINDLFVAACAQAAVHYHGEMGASLPTITATVVVNTQSPTEDRDDDGDGTVNQASDGQSFLPVAIELPGDGVTAVDRLEIVRSEVWNRRTMLKTQADSLNLISAIGGLVPSGIASSMAVNQAAKVDFATSNIPGPPIPTWFAAKPISHLYPVGPVAGTAFNVTLMTYDREALFGIHIDPAAVTDTNLLKLAVGRGFGDFGVARR